MTEGMLWLCVAILGIERSPPASDLQVRFGMRSLFRVGKSATKRRDEFGERPGDPVAS